MRPPPRTTRVEGLAVAGVALVAAALRLTGLDWDQGQHLHPDERFLTLVALALEWPHGWAAYLDSATSPLNPPNVGFPFFVYGTLPLFLVRGCADLLGLTDYAHLHLVGRVLAALFDTVTVLLTWRLGRGVFGPRVGVAAAALMAVCVAAIQHAHFFTVDAFGACFAAAALLATVRIAGGAGPATHLAFGVSLAAAAACRANLVLLAPLYPGALAVALVVGASTVRRTLTGSALAVAAAITVFRLVNPYAFAGPGLFDVTPDPRFLANFATVRGMVDGSTALPPAYQWVGRVRPLFGLGNLAGTSLGPAWALAALLGGLGWLRGRRPGSDRAHELGGRLVLVWALLFALYHASQFVATQRYFLPVLPVLAVAAALFVDGVRRHRVAFVAVLVATSLWAIAFHAVYRAEHPRVAASRWIAASLAPASALLHEHWDDAVPLPLEGLEVGRFESFELAVYAREDAAKLGAFVEALDRADAIVLSSDRAYGSIPRAPWQYPLARRYYELLFDGALGFRLERSFTSFPRIGRFEIADSWSEEAFRVYDHPSVYVFTKTGAFARERVQALLSAVRLETVVERTPAAGSAAFRSALPTSLRPTQRKARTQEPVTIHRMGSLEAAARWLLAWVALAFVSLPLARRLLPGHPEQVGLLALLLAWLAPGHAAWWLAWLGVAPFSGGTVPALALGLAVLGGTCAWRDRDRLREWLPAQARVLATTAAVFLLVFGVFALLRAVNPSVYWGEKPMDFAILGSLVRARALPPADPWFAGETLNYFHFGHAMVAAFARTCGVPAAIAFNLGIASAGGLAGAAAYTAGRVLTRSFQGGVLAVLLVVFVGNLAGPLAWLAHPERQVDFDFFWSVSRVVEGTINEFPYWSFLFGDLHAHVLALPFEIALVALGCTWLSARPAPGARTLLGGWLLGVTAATSPWSLPLAFGVQGAFLATAARDGIGSWPGAMLRWAALGAVAFLVTAPFWLDYTTASIVGIGLERADGSSPADLATIFGLFVAALVPAMLVTLGEARTMSGRRLAAWCGLAATAVAVAFLLRGAGAACAAGVAGLALGAGWEARTTTDRAAWWLAALAAGAVLAAEVLVLSDRMNTVFKLHLAAWPLAAIAAATLLPRGLRALPVLPARVLSAAAFALVAAAIATSVLATRGLLRFPKVESPPTLDGTRYLMQRDPDARAAYRWLNQKVVGVPVILEASGTAYSEAARVAMNTGLPTPAGWEHHLVQQARDREEVRRRAAEVDRFFETRDRIEAGRILDRFRADFVFVGRGERRRYPASGLTKLETWDRLEPVFRQGEVTLYATPGATSARKTWVDPVPTADRPLSPPVGSYREPRDLARARDGTVFVVDAGNRRVQRIRFGRPDLAFGGPRVLRDPRGIAIADDGRVFVADAAGARIATFSGEGEASGSLEAGLVEPRGVALGSDGSLWVTDAGRGSVLRHPDGGEAWQPIRSGPPLDTPVGIAVHEGEVFVGDVGRGEILVYTEAGSHLRSFRVPGWDHAELEAYLEVGPDGTLWVTDPTGDRVLLYDRGGRALGVAVPGGSLHRPTGIALLDSHNAMVASRGSDPLVIVRRPRESEKPPAGNE